MEKEDKVEKELMPCPFCGGEAKMVIQETPEANGAPTYDFRFEQVRSVKCSECGIKMSCGFQDMDGAIAEQHAIEFWNERQAHQQQALIEELVKALKVLVDEEDCTFVSLNKAKELIAKAERKREEEKDAT